MSIENRLQFRIGDPTWNNQHLLVTLIQSARTLIFDCGPMHLPRSIAHQVRDICITHRHMDHLMGFPAVARTLLASRRPIRVYGPRGITDALSNMLRAFEWNYAAELSMKLDVTEVVDTKIVTTSRLDIRSKFEPRKLSESRRKAKLHGDKELEISAFDLEHHTVPCLGYRLKLPDEWRVDAAKVQALGARPGPWLGELLRRLERGERPAADEVVPPPPARRKKGGAAADAAPDPALPEIKLEQVVAEAITEERGAIVGFVTDTGASDRVRETLREHLTDADVLCIESFYARSEAAVARKVGHLTSREAGEIANDLGVGQLIITHISQRYNPRKILREVRREFADAVPKTDFLLGDDEYDDDTEAEHDTDTDNAVPAAE